MFRLDRFLTLYLFYPLLKRRSSAVEPKIPILMYHSISDDDTEPGIPAYYRTATPSALFREQMHWLHKNDYAVISLTRAIRRLEMKTADNDRYVVLTFDDGFYDFIKHAWPILGDFGFTATVFLPTAFIGIKRKLFKGRECLIWPEVRELNRYGISFGSHTVNHVQLYDLDWPKIERELIDSKHGLEDQIGSPANEFAYPFAYPQADETFCHHFSNTLQKCGYHYCVTTCIGRTSLGDNRLRLRRLPVNGADDLALFGAKIQGAYDWVALGQSFIKFTKFASHHIKRKIFETEQSGKDLGAKL